VHQFESTNITSEESGLSSVDVIVPCIDSAAFLTLDSALLIEGSWSSYKKTPDGTATRLEPSLASSSTTLFRPRRTWQYSSPLKLFSNLQISWQYIFSSRQNHSLLAWLVTSNESPNIFNHRKPSAIVI
jgi:hypothetical protein